MTLVFAITFDQFCKCFLRANTRGHKMYQTIPDFLGPAGSEILSQPHWRPAQALLHLDQTCLPGSLPVRPMTLFWGVTYLPAGVHPGREAHLALPGTQAQPLREPDGRAGRDGACTETSPVGSGFRGLAPVMGQGPVEQLWANPLPSAAEFPCAGSHSFLHPCPVSPGTELRQIRASRSRKSLGGPCGPISQRADGPGARPSRPAGTAPGASYLARAPEASGLLVPTQEGRLEDQRPQDDGVPPAALTAAPGWRPDWPGKALQGTRMQRAQLHQRPANTPTGTLLLPQALPTARLPEELMVTHRGLFF